MTGFDPAPFIDYATPRVLACASRWSKAIRLHPESLPTLAKVLREHHAAYVEHVNDARAAGDRDAELSALGGLAVLGALLAECDAAAFCNRAQ